MESLRDRQKAEVLSTLLRVGGELFESKGFRSTTIEDITSAAGVAKGTFYNYFQSKEELAIELVNQHEELGTAEIEQFFQTHQEIQDQVLAILSLAAEWIQHRPELTWVSLIEQLKRDVNTKKYKKSLFRRMMTEAFTRGQATGEITLRRSPADLAIDLEGILIIHVARWYHYGAKGDLLSVLHPAFDIYLCGALTGDELPGQAKKNRGGIAK